METNISGNTEVIKFSEFGEAFGTRAKAAKLRQRIESLLFAGKFVVFDLADIRVVSNSFADELFGKLVESFGLTNLKGKSKFRNANPFVTAVISGAIRNVVRPEAR